MQPKSGLEAAVGPSWEPLTPPFKLEFKGVKKSGVAQLEGPNLTLSLIDMGGGMNLAGFWFPSLYNGANKLHFTS